jgi:membrane-associated protein
VLVVIALIIFVETGLLFPFLPGDSLLFAAGLLSPQLGLSLPVLILVAACAAVAGDQMGYFIGRRYGRRLFKPDARVFKTAYLDKADAFFVKHGPAALVLARFVPIVRTFVPPIVGMSQLPYRKFVIWNVLGGAGWVVVGVLAGFWLGRIPFIADNVELIAVAIVVVSIIPIVIETVRSRRRPR